MKLLSRRSLAAAAVAAALVPLASASAEHGTPASAGQPKFSALVFTRTAAFRHTDCIPQGTAAIGQLGGREHFEVDATEDANAFNDANLAGYDVVIFLCTTGDVLNDTQQAAFERYIRAGGGYVGIHSASDTEYDWAWYGGLVGAYFRDHPGWRRQPAVPDGDDQRRGRQERGDEAPPGTLDARGGVVQLPHQPARPVSTC